MNNYTASTTRSALPLFGGPSSKVFLYANAAQNLLNTGLHVAKGAQQLYLYHNGRYVPGEELLRGHLANDLASDWSPARADAIGRWLYDSAPDLWERPPLDRVRPSRCRPSGLRRLKHARCGQRHRGGSPALLRGADSMTDVHPNREGRAVSGELQAQPLCDGLPTARLKRETGRPCLLAGLVHDEVTTLAQPPVLRG